jgi:hypothetical protein
MVELTASLRHAPLPAGFDFLLVHFGEKNLQPVPNRLNPGRFMGEKKWNSPGH